MNPPPRAHRRYVSAAIAGAVALAAAGPAIAAELAEEPQKSADESKTDLAVNPPLDSLVTGAAAAAWLGSELLKSHLAPLSCRWCETNGLDRGARSALVWHGHQQAAITISNIGAYVVAPVAAFGLTLLASDDPRSKTLLDFLVIAEAAALAGDVAQLVKFTVGRQRPYANAGLPNPDTGAGRYDANLSFYSAHTNITFALAAAAGTVGLIRGYRWAPAAFIVGGLIATVTGYLRIAADQHYLTDVVTGAVAGTAIGVVVPYAFHRRSVDLGDDMGKSRSAFILTPLPGARGLSLTAVW